MICITDKITYASFPVLIAPLFRLQSSLIAEFPKGHSYADFMGLHLLAGSWHAHTLNRWRHEARWVVIQTSFARTINLWCVPLRFNYVYFLTEWQESVLKETMFIELEV